ncbi:endonuclease/exonuclease/phosphatase family protein [Diaminobutyricibacter sp. McL0618]|uniref:endonuclease/exonuclease/phosphatase family protein n=1 Tax=Leifsonia sp. McL0618 TaxID=3415677 RepID=UPI003CF19172
MASNASVRKIVALNIQQGGGSRVPALVEKLLGYDADLLVITEFRSGATGADLISRLIEAGYGVTFSNPEAGDNSVLIASRSPIVDGCRFAPEVGDARHLWQADLDWITVCGVYMPQLREKLPYWDAIIADTAAGSNVDLFIGDFNTGRNDLDRDPASTKFVGPDRMDRIAETGYVDVWRDEHPNDIEYTWHSKKGRGYRLDLAFASRQFAGRITRSWYDQTPRTTKLTDHAALIVELT